jgi:hypothetical protein
MISMVQFFGLLKKKKGGLRPATYATYNALRAEVEWPLWPVMVGDIVGL